MTYELAKELKDYGFNQLGNGFYRCIHEERIFDLKNGEKSICDCRYFPLQRCLYVPTLSELIEECGDNCRLLIKNPNNDWEAGYGFDYYLYDNRINEKRPSSIGNTPEEAVANLWLKLNK